MELPDITFKAIGTVHSGEKERTRDHSHKGGLSTIEIDPRLAESLDNLEEFTHIIVLYHIHKSRRPAPLKVHPMHRTDRPPVGVFASRSPDRPNPIGKTTVKLIKREGNILTVEGLDAIDGTPVIDIKPYLPGLDSVENAVAPSWMMHG
jgi:tRNA-Thr(GGU) m(6)t(6)A37 methyltransferase TsaA